MADPLFHECRGIMGTANTGQDMALRNALLHFQAKGGARAPEVAAEPERFCNKCGYVGPDTQHQRPDGSGICGYLSRTTHAQPAPQALGAPAGNVFEQMRARTLLAHLWRKYDTAGISMGRSHEAVVLEAVLALLGDPDPEDMALLDKDSGTFINEVRTYLSSKMAERLFGRAAATTGGQS